MARIDQRGSLPMFGSTWHVVDSQLSTDSIMKASHAGANLHCAVIGFNSQSCQGRICRDDRGYCLHGHCLESQLAAPGADASHHGNDTGSTEYDSHGDDGALRLQAERIIPRVLARRPGIFPEQRPSRAARTTLSPRRSCPPAGRLVARDGHSRSTTT